MAPLQPTSTNKRRQTSLTEFAIGKRPRLDSNQPKKPLTKGSTTLRASKITPANTEETPETGGSSKVNADDEPSDQDDLAEIEAGDCSDDELFADDFDTPATADEQGPDLTLKPMSSLRDITADMLDASQKDGLEHFVQSSRQHYIRVGTLCSGTDAPIHIMNLFGMLKNTHGDQVFNIINAFGCEIEPFKQGFLLRNSKPQLLFRDARDFARDGAKTARLVSGVEAEIPEVDMLIAGTSCVDFSGLSSRKSKEFEGLAAAAQGWKKMHEERLSGPNPGLTRDDLNHNDWRTTIDTLLGTGRQSTVTWAAAMNYLCERQPKIAVFENVESAPWATVTEFVLPLCGYAASFHKLDTKRFYLPQTRSRKYLIAFSQEFFGKESAQRLADLFGETIAKLERRYSSTITDFLLPTNSHDLHRARNEMEHAAQSTREKDTDWSFSRARHSAFRRKNNLPDDRPWIRWRENGISNPPAKMWKPWETRQTNRVSDLLDLIYLVGILGRNDKHGFYDPAFKAQIIDCSQNVDRVNVTTAFGATGCLTPGAIPVLTLEARPLTGTESLKLQGMPIENFNMSVETQAQLQDLAGNAMTTTVVGAAILASLQCVAKLNVELLKTDNEHADWLQNLFPKRDYEEAKAKDRCTFSQPVGLGGIQGRCLPLDDLVLFAHSSPEGGVRDIIKLGQKTRRRCVCYHILAYSSMELYLCKICGASFCKSCKGNPDHQLEKSKQSFDDIGALSYAKAEDELRRFFPSILPFLSGFDATAVANVCTMLQGSGYSDREEASAFGGAILAGLCSTNYQLSFFETTDATRIEYVSKDNFMLRAVLEDNNITWYLYLDKWSATGQKLLGKHRTSQPIARAVLGPDATSQFPVAWDFWFPRNVKFELRFRLGKDRSLQIASIGSGLKNVPAHVQRQIKALVGTRWTYHPECGFPENAFWVLDNCRNKLYLFKDVNAIGPASLDEFVITSVTREMGRAPPAESRQVLLRINAECQIHRLIEEIESFVSSNGGSIEGHEIIVTAFLHGWWVGPQQHSVGIPAFRADKALRSMPNFPSCPPVAIRLPTRDQSLALHSSSDPGQASAYPCSRDQVLLDMSLPIFGTSDEAITDMQMTLRDLDLSQQLDFSDFARLIRPCYSAVEQELLKLLGDRRMIVLFAGVELSEKCDRCALKPPEAILKKPEKRATKLEPVVAEYTENDQQLYNKKLEQKPLTFRIDHNVDQSLVAHPKKQKDIAYIDIRFVARAHTLLQQAQSHLPAHPAHCSGFSVTTGTFGLQFGILEDPRPELEPVRIQAPASLEELGIPATQPERFRRNRPLLKEQLASLEWMISRENDYEEVAFTEVESAEVYIDQLRLRAQAKASRQILRRGRVVADSVGFGKTAVCLGLIDRQRSVDRREFLLERTNNPVLKGLAHLHATLVIVPKQLTRQWESEANRFLKSDAYRICVIQSFEDLQNHGKDEELEKADVIICSNKVFQDAKYVTALSTFCDPGGVEVAATPKFYRAWYKQVHEVLRLLRAEFRDYLQQSPKDAKSRLPHLRATLDSLREYQQSAGRTSFLPSDQSRWVPMHLLEYYTFSRVIWDEFPYENIHVSEFVTNCPTSSKWMLSGTPPLASLGDICKVAGLFNVHLARPLSLVRGRQPEVCEHAPLRPLTTLEEAEQYESRHSPTFLQERHCQAVEFVRRFMRSNVRDMEDITTVTKPVVLSLTQNSLLAYMELQQELSSRTFNANIASADSRRRLMSRVDWKGSKLGKERSMEALMIRASASFEDVKVQAGLDGNGQASTNVQVAESMYNMSTKTIRDIEDRGRELFGRAFYLGYRIAYIMAANHTSAVDNQEDRQFSYYNALYQIINGILQVNFEAYSGWDAYESVLRMLIWDDNLDRHLESAGDSSEFLPPKSDVESWQKMVQGLWNGMRFCPPPNSRVNPAERPTKPGARQNALDKKQHWLGEFSDWITKSPLHSRRWYLVDKLSDASIPNVRPLLEMEWEFKVPWEMQHRDVSEDTDWALVPIRELRQPLTIHNNQPFDINTIRAQDRTRRRKLGDVAKTTTVKAKTLAEELAKATTKSGNITKPVWHELLTRRGLNWKLLETKEEYANRLSRVLENKASDEDYISPECCSLPVVDMPLEGRQRIRGGRMEVIFNQLMHTVDKLVELLGRIIVAHAKKNVQKVVVDILKGTWHCDAHSHNQLVATDDHYISLLCGHVQCSLPDDATVMETAVCGVRGCTQPIENVCIPLSKLTEEARAIHMCDLGDGALAKDPTAYMDEKYGSVGPKAAAIASLVNATEEEDQVVVFAQNKAIMSDIYAQLKAEGISHVTPKELEEDEALALERFKAGLGARVAEAQKRKVLIQMVNSEQAAGSNLHNANHVMFVSPLVSRNQADWDAQMKQALGRCVRFRQTKTVHVYHLTMDETIEVDTLEWRMKKEILVPHGRAVGRFSEGAAPDFLARFDDARLSEPTMTAGEDRAISLLARDDVQYLMGDDYFSLAAVRSLGATGSAETGNTAEEEEEVDCDVDMING